MAYPRPFVRLTAEGCFGVSAAAPAEIWRCNFNFATNSGTDYSPPKLLAFATTAATVFSAYHSNAGVKAGTTCFLTDVSAATIDTDGTYVGGGAQPTTRFHLTSATAGVGTVTGPWSQALCLTWRTAIVRGPGHAGRVYWPALAMAVQPSSGVIGLTAQTAILTPAQTMVTQLNAAANSTFGAGHALCVMSKVGAGVAAPVTSVQVGGRLDTQERREGKTSEAYISATIATTRDTLEERDERLRQAIEDAIDRALEVP